MRSLLDTHSFLWMSLDEAKLSEAAREIIADLDNDLLLSPASYWVEFPKGSRRLNSVV